MDDDLIKLETLAEIIVPLLLAGAYVKLMFELGKKVNEDGNQDKD